MPLALVIFLALAVVSFRNLPEGVEFRPVFMLGIALIGAPAAFLLNAFEYGSIAKAAGHSVTFANALQVSLTASVANLLPAPGGVAVRTAALKLEGSTLATAVSVNAIAGVIWIGATALLAGLALLTDPSYTVRGAVVGVIGVAILIGGAWALRWRAAAWQRTFAELFVIETATTLAAAFRVALAFAAIGESASLALAVMIASAQVLATAIGIFPAGLGLREALAAGLAMTVGALPAVAVAASAVERVSALVGKMLFVVAVGIYVRHVDRRAASTGAPDAAPSPSELQVQAAALGGEPPSEGTLGEPEGKNQ